jgi:hypothetical protein
MPISKKSTKSKMTKRSVKKTTSKSRKPQKTSKVTKYKKAYDACVQKALETCAKRHSMVKSKKITRKPKKSTRKSPQKIKKTKTIQKSGKKSDYQLFVSKHLKDPQFEGLKLTEKVKIIAKMWQETK